MSHSKCRHVQIRNFNTAHAVRTEKKKSVCPASFLVTVVSANAILDFKNAFFCLFFKGQDLLKTWKTLIYI